MLLEQIKTHLLLWPLAASLALYFDRLNYLNNYLTIIAAMLISSCFKTKKYELLLLSMLIIAANVTLNILKYWWLSLSIFSIFVILGLILLYLEKTREKK